MHTITKQLSLVAAIALFAMPLGGAYAQVGTACQAPTINLSKGSTDATTGGQVSRLQRFLVQHESGSSVLISGTFDAITESALKRFQTKYGIANSGAANTTGYGAVGPLTRATMQRTCGASIPTTTSVTPLRNLTPEVQVETVADNKVVGRYQNLPANSQILLIDFYSGKQVTGSDTIYVRAGGSGSFSFTIDDDWNDGSGSLFKVQAMPAGASWPILAVSKNFQDARNVKKSPTCTFTSSSYQVQSGERFKLSWSSKGAKFVFWEGKEESKKGSTSLIETEPGVHQYHVTAQGDTLQALCFVHVTVTGTGGTSSPLPVSPVTTTKPSGSFSNSSLTAYVENPVISGAAKGVTTVGFSIGKGDKVYGSGDIQVINGVWTHRVGTSLANGKYDITLSYYDAVGRKSVTLSKETLVVSAYSEAREAAGSPVIVSVYESSSSDGTIVVRLEGNDRTLPQPLVLSASRPVKWVVENPDDLPLTKIIVVEYSGRQTVSAPQGVKIEYLNHNPDSDDSYSSKKGIRADDLLALLKRKFGYGVSGVFEEKRSTNFIELYMGIKG